MSYKTKRWIRDFAIVSSLMIGICVLLGGILWILSMLFEYNETLGLGAAILLIIFLLSALITSDI